MSEHCPAGAALALAAGAFLAAGALALAAVGGFLAAGPSLAVGCKLALNSASAAARRRPSACSALRAVGAWKRLGGGPAASAA